MNGADGWHVRAGLPGRVYDSAARDATVAAARSRALASLVAGLPPVFLGLPGAVPPCSFCRAFASTANSGSSSTPSTVF
jgi:hypothetical protein